MQTKQTKIKSHYLIIAVILILIFILHLLDLTALPVFADESIYIRWAQLIIDDANQYLFFPLNDGKTPIFIWLLVPFQFLFTDQLFAGRFLSVLVGLVQIFIMGKIAQTLGFEKKYQYLVMLLSGVLPFWFFHHHLALMDGLLTLFLSLSVWQTIKLTNSLKSKWPIFWLGLSFGFAMLTKIPALLFIPGLLVLSFFLSNGKLKGKFVTSAYTAIGIFFGLLIFVLLRLHPAFGQLFSRGSDFLFSWREVLLEGKWQETMLNWPTYLSYFVQYFTWPAVLVSLLGLLFKQKKQVLIFHLSWMAFALPIFIMGKVVYPRYLFPAGIFFTLALITSIRSLFEQKKAIALGTIALLVISFLQSFNFIYPLLFKVEATPFVSADRAQYLTEWSAGYGVKETVSLIQTLAQDRKVLALSEGYFGTLPDGLLMYLHRRNLENLFVIGIGQPISRFSEEAKKLAEDYDQVLLIGNSHRLRLDLNQADLLFESCRPFDAPCHQVWDVTSLVKNE